MGTIDLTDVVTDSDLAEEFTIRRIVGTFARGGWQQSGYNIAGYGVATDASPEDLEMLPEGDRVTGAQVFYTHERIYETQVDGEYGASGYGTTGYGGATQQVSDQIIWNNHIYRILHVTPMLNRGYWKGVGVRMLGR